MIPKKFVIGSVPYDVTMVDGFIKEDGKEYLGCVKYPNQVIELSKDQGRECMHKTLIHEITHALLVDSGMSRYNKEDFVDCLGSALYDFLSRNDVSFIKKSYQQEKPIHVKEGIPLQNMSPVKEITDVKEETDKDSTEDSPSVSKKLPINNERSSSYNISQLTKIPDFWKTGIKVIDGERHYKTRYVCDGCGFEGTRYLLAGSRYTNCFKCRKEIKIHPASDEGFPNRDEWGNYYISEGVRDNEDEKTE